MGTLADVGPGEGDEDQDSSLAQERTELAWNRSGLAVAVAVGILVRRLWPLQGARSGIALAFIAFGALTWLVGMRLSRRRASGPDPTGLLGAPTLRLVTAGTVMLAVAGVFFGVVLPG